MSRNYGRELNKLLEKFDEDSAKDHVPSLLLHSCCAPCSSYVLEYLSQWFSITVFYDNPNITDAEEYKHRVAEQKRLTEIMPLPNPAFFTETDYEPERFFEAVKGFEQIPEGGERCARCFALRLRDTALFAAEKQYDYFTTTLTISPLKNAETINQIGEALGKEYGVPFLPSDFKKQNGYKRSIELSREYELYRQDYCGCVFSKAEAERRRRKEEDE